MAGTIPPALGPLLPDEVGSFSGVTDRGAVWRDEYRQLNRGTSASNAVYASPYQC